MDRENQAVQSNDQLRRIIDSVPTVITVLDSDGKFIYANRVTREYTGLNLDQYRSVDVIGRLIHPDDAEKVRAARKHAFSKGAPYEQEARLLGKDGVYRWFLFRCNPSVEEGGVKRWYGTATEIESRKQEEERVRQENVRLEERTRIARELHDTLLQTVMGATLQLGGAVQSLPSDSPIKPKLDQIVELMEKGIAEGRDTIQGLRSSNFQTLDLVVALSGIQQGLAVRPDIDFRANVVGQRQPLRSAVQHEIYSIGREALVNAFCHSGAKRIDLELEYG